MVTVEPDPRQPFASTERVRRRMQDQRRRDTAPELALRRALHRRGLRYRLDVPVVPGTRRRRVDIVFPRAKIAVFVDGCFWHGCPEHGRSRGATNEWYWQPKIRQNMERDADTNQRLRKADWLVLRFWEHDDPEQASVHVLNAIRERTTGDRHRRRLVSSFR